MAQQIINVGTSANKGDGDPLRTAFTKVNDNFTDAYTRIIALEGGSLVTDFKGSVFADDSSVMIDAVNGKVVGPVETTTLKTTSTVTMSNLPTSDAGLAVGQLWNDSGTVKVKQ
jgi:hypothetical protein